MDFKLRKENDLKIDRLLIISSNPLATGFLLREIDTSFEETAKNLQITIRATLSNRKTDHVDILFAIQTSGYLRFGLFNFEFKVSGSFKTKCVHENIGKSKLLVGIDIFDSKESNIHPISFTVRNLALLSESHKISAEKINLTMLQHNFLISQKMIYFIVDLGELPSKNPRQRFDYRVCFKEDNINLVADERNTFFDYLSRENLLGFLDQESKTIKHEFKSIFTKIKKNFNSEISLTCEEFLDFEILWTYQNIGLFGREATIFSPENDSEIKGIHSILSTPLNMVSFRTKKTKPTSSSIFSLYISAPRSVKHDFSQKK